MSTTRNIAVDIVENVRIFAEALAVYRNAILKHHMLAHKPRGRICTEFGIGVLVVDVITLAKFFGRSVKGCRFCVGRKRTLVID